MHVKGHASSSLESRYEGRGEQMEKEGRKERVEKEEGARLYLISAEVSIEQKVQQAGSVVKP